MSNPFVSVIILSYNHAHYLDERIRSVLNQTYQNFEVIILDDKSTDNSLEVINQYKDNPHVSQLVVNEENSGSTFMQWHKGFELAKGEIVWIAECEDSCDTEFLQTLVCGYVEHNVVMAFCKSSRYGIYGNQYNFTLQEKLAGISVMNGGDFITQYMIDSNIVANASSVIFNRQIALSVDKQYMTMSSEGEWLFWMELMNKGNVFYCNKELNYFRFRDPNIPKLLRYRGIKPLDQKEIYDFIVKHGYLKGFSCWKEKIRRMSYFYHSEFESKTVRKEVFRKWDKNRLARLYFFAGKVKSLLLLPLSKSSEIEPNSVGLKLIHADHRENLKQLKILAVVVTYRPEKDLLIKNVAAFIDHVDKVLIWENTPNEEKEKYRFIDNKKVEYQGDGINSISHALNYAWRYAEDNGYDYLLTMDQDSVWEDFPFYLHETAYNEKAPQGIWGPNAYIPTDVEISNPNIIITSGMLLQVELISKIGGWDETFSIDCVDDDFCLRAKRMGIKTYYWGACILNQRYGSPEKAKLLGRTFDIVLKNYSASRLYSIYRNHVILIRKFPEVWSIKNDFKYYWIPNIKWVAIFEKNRIKKLHSIFKGILDGYRFQLPA